MAASFWKKFTAALGGLFIKMARFKGLRVFVRTAEFIRRLTLSQRFMLAGLVILFAGMLGIGAWVEKQIVTGVINRTGATTALYVDSFVSPLLQELAQTDNLLPEHLDALNNLLADTPMGHQLVAFKIWNTRGRLLYSVDASAVGKTYPMSEGLLRARLGEVASKISSLDDEENKALGVVHDRLLETYSPVWLSGTNQVIAVAEFYQLTDELDRQVSFLVRRSWLVVGLAIFLVYLLLAGFVRNASNTITRQQAELARKMDQLTGVLGQNQELHERVRRASASVALLNEANLRRIGSELHDGPTQNLGLSLLKLDALIGRLESGQVGPGTSETVEQISEIETVLQIALKEIRAIAIGLSLPQLSELDLVETIIRIVRTHERQTRTRVQLNLKDLPAHAALPLKITVYRLIQEALNNAFRHAGGTGQQVDVRCEKGELLVEISDDGPGFLFSQIGKLDGRLGLGGMQERVESLGGLFTIDSQIGLGTRVYARLPLNVEGEDG